MFRNETLQVQKHGAFIIDRKVVIKIQESHSHSMVLNKLLGLFYIFFKEMDTTTTEIIIVR